MRHLVLLLMLLACLVPQAFAGKVSPKGGDSKCVWGGNYSFQFKIRPEKDEKSVKLFFYGFPVGDGSWSFNGYEIDRKGKHLVVFTYSCYKHRKVDTALENVLATGDSKWTTNRRAIFVGNNGGEYVLEDNKVYTVQVQAKDKKHNATLMMDGKKVATASYDASMTYKGTKPTKFQTILNKTFATKKDKKDAICGELKERGYLNQNKDAGADSDFKALSDFLKKGGDPNSTGADGEPRLVTAVIKKQPDCVKLLLDKGANPDSTAKNGTAVLYTAVANNQKEVVALLLDHGANTNFRAKNGYTPLHLAVIDDYADIVELLIKKDAKVNQQDDKGATPLCLATVLGSEKSVAVLLEHGADTEIADNKGYTPLFFSISEDVTPLPRLLLSKGANPNARNSEGATVLAIAISLNRADIVEELIKRGADVNAKSCGALPMILGIASGNPKIISLLKNAGAKAQ